MTRKEIDGYVSKNKWRELLRALPEGEHEMFFPTIEKIKSFKATAYEFNGDGIGKKFAISVDKVHKFVKVKVSQS